MDDIERELDNCAEIFDLMDVFEIAGNEEDISSFTELQPQLQSLRTLIDRQVLNRPKLMEGLDKAFHKNIEAIHNRYGKIRQGIDSAEIVDPDADPIKVIRKLTLFLHALEHDQTLAMKYTKYQQQLKVIETRIFLNLS